MNIKSILAKPFAGIYINRSGRVWKRRSPISNPCSSSSSKQPSKQSSARPRFRQHQIARGFCKAGSAPRLRGLQTLYRKRSRKASIIFSGKGQPIYFARPAAHQRVKYIPITKVQSPTISIRHATLFVLHGRNRQFEIRRWQTDIPERFANWNGWVVPTGPAQRHREPPRAKYLRSNSFLLSQQTASKVGRNWIRSWKNDPPGDMSAHQRYSAMDADVLRPPDRTEREKSRQIFPPFQRDGAGNELRTL